MEVVKRELIRHLMMVNHVWEVVYVNADLGYFDHMIPCGIRGKSVTSMRVELKVTEVDEQAVSQRLLYHFQTLFEAELSV